MHRLVALLAVIGLCHATTVTLVDNTATPYLTSAGKRPPVLPIPSPDTWPSALAFLSTCGAPVPNNTLGQPEPCNYTANFNVSSLPSVEGQHGRLSLSSISQLYHFAEEDPLSVAAWNDTAFQKWLRLSGGGSSNYVYTEPLFLMIKTGALLFACERMYVGWVYNNTGKFPPASGDYDPRCVCDDAVNYFLRFVNIPNTQGVPPPYIPVSWNTSDPNERWDAGFGAGTSANNWVRAQLSHMASVISYDDAIHNCTAANDKAYTGGARPWPARYFVELATCRAIGIVGDPTATPQTNSVQVTADPLDDSPIGSRRYPHGWCKGHLKLAQGSLEYVRCVQDETWRNFWYLPPDSALLATPPAAYTAWLPAAPAPTPAGTPTPAGAPTPAGVYQPSVMTTSGTPTSRISSSSPGRATLAVVSSVASAMAFLAIATL